MFIEPDQSSIYVDADIKDIDSCLSALGLLWFEREKALWQIGWPSESENEQLRLINKSLDLLDLYGTRSVERAALRFEKLATPENTFLLMCCLIYSLDSAHVERIEKKLVDDESLHLAAQTALSYCDPLRVQFFIDRWWFKDNDIFRTVVFPAAIAHPDSDKDLLIKAGLNDESSQVRAVTYRMIGELFLFDYLEALRVAFCNEKEKSLFEAAKTLCHFGDTSSLHYLPYGLDGLSASCKTRHLMVWAMLSDDDPFAQWLAQEKNPLVSEGQKLLAIAFRGDPAYLLNLGIYLQQKDNFELAAHVLRYITGVNFINIEDGSFNEEFELITSDNGAEKMSEVLRGIGLLTLSLDKNARYINGVDIRKLSNLGELPLELIFLQKYHVFLYKKIEENVS